MRLIMDPENPYSKMMGTFKCANVSNIELDRQKDLAKNMFLSYKNFKLAIVRCSDIPGADCAQDIDAQLANIYVDVIDMS